MAEWIEVPAHRIYVICARELAILRSEASPLKNLAVLLSYETVGNFAARHRPPILAARRDMIHVNGRPTGIRMAFQEKDDDR